ncbi:MAG: nuclear cap-binding protein subunit 2 [Chloroflexota bacterium]|nr:nuclear cap-binding protein subunit 2 [Chloroflexota bacterium]
MRTPGDGGLVAVSTYGHRWMYPFHMTTEQMHDVAQFNRVTPCPFCFSEWQARVNAQAWSPSRLVN